MLKILWPLFFISQSVFAISFDELKNLALENSSQLKAQDMESHALSNDRNLRGKWQNPQLMSQFGSLKAGNSVGATVEVSLIQAIPMSDKFSLRKEIGDLALKSQETQKGFFENWVQHQAILAAWRVIISQELLNHGIERARRIELVLQYIKTHPRVSVRQRVEFSLISTLVLQLKKMQEQKKFDLLSAEKDLEFWVGKPLKATDFKVDIPSEDQLLTPNDLKLISDAEYKIAQNQLQISKIDSDLSKKERRPDLFLGAGYRVENVDPANHFTYGVLGINIPIWDTGSLRQESANARTRRDEKQLEETEKRLTIKHEKQREMVLLRREEMKLLPKKMVGMQEDVIHEAEAGFKKGLIDVNMFLQTETQTHDVIDQVYIAWMGFLDNLSTFQLMRGESLEWTRK